MKFIIIIPLLYYYFMGINKEELIDGINYGGVGQYLGEAEKSNNNLFI